MARGDGAWCERLRVGLSEGLLERVCFYIRCLHARVLMLHVLLLVCSIARCGFTNPKPVAGVSEVAGAHQLSVSLHSVRQVIAEGVFEDVQELCNSPTGCDPNEQDACFGMTPLHWATFYGSVRACRWCVHDASRCL